MVERERVLFERCAVCGGPLPGSGTRYCSRACRMVMADFEEFTTLQFILANARWAGAPTQAQAQREYLRDRMWSAVRRLSSSADVLGEVLVEILEIQEEEALSDEHCVFGLSLAKKNGPP